MSTSHSQGFTKDPASGFTADELPVLGPNAAVALSICTASPALLVHLLLVLLELLLLGCHGGIGCAV